MWLSFKELENFITILQNNRYSKRASTRHARKKELSIDWREILVQIQVVSRRNTLCISRLTKRRVAPKDPAGNDKTFSEYAKLKRERGESLIHPAVAPVSLMSVSSAQVYLRAPTLRRTEPCGPLHGGGPEPYGRWK